jgi:hypothetical protein
MARSYDGRKPDDYERNGVEGELTAYWRRWAYAEQVRAYRNADRIGRLKRGAKARRVSYRRATAPVERAKRMWREDGYLDAAVYRRLHYGDAAFERVRKWRLSALVDV